MSFPVAGRDARLAERLWSMYALERAADQTTPPVSFAIATVGITYVATTLVLLIGRGSSQVPLAVTLFLPLTPVGLFTALTALDRVSQKRGAYLDALEQELARLHGHDARGSLTLRVPALRQLTRGDLRPTEGSRLKRAAILAAQPYALSGVFVVVYIGYVLGLVHPQPAQSILGAAYLALMLRNSIQLVRAKSESKRQVTGLRLDGTQE